MTPGIVFEWICVLGFGAMIVLMVAVCIISFFRIPK